MTRMKIYLSNSPKNYMGERVPIVIETNLAWALPYWQARKKQNPEIVWVFD